MKCQGLLAGCACTIPTPINLRHPGLGDATVDPVARELRAAINASRPITGFFLPIAVVLDADPDCLMCVGRDLDGRVVLMASTAFVENTYRNFGRSAVWGGVFHELNHVRAGHLIAPSTTFDGQWPREIASDLAAQRILARLRGDLDAFSALLESFGNDVSDTHPAGVVRARAARDAAQLLRAGRRQ